MNTNATADLKWAFRRDETGRLMSVRGPGGRETQFDYEPFPEDPGRVKTATRQCNGSQVICEFDRLGHRTRTRDGAGTVAYTWTRQGQLRTICREGGPSLVYSYDPLGRLAKQDLVGIGSIEYRYDFMGRLEAMETPAGPVKYEYWTGQGKIKRTLPNQVCTFWDHDAEGRLTTITHVDPGDFVMARFSCEYRPDGLIAGITEWWPQGERRLGFEYDQVRRLVQVDDGKGGIWRADYDPMGNRIRGGFHGEERGECRYDWAGRLLSVSGLPCTHDDGGNLNRVTVNGIERRFEFDHESRLYKTGDVTYRHDGDGFLISRTVLGRRTTYLPDPTTDVWCPLLETDADGRRRIYVWEDRAPLAVVEDGKARFFLADHLGSVRCVVDAAGAVVERRDYSPFGVPTEKTTGTGRTPGFAGRTPGFAGPAPGFAGLAPGFAGLFFDPAARLYLARARAYCPELGRFLQIDPQHPIPSGVPRDLSLFVYCADNPVSLRDLNGAKASPVYKDIVPVDQWAIKSELQYRDQVDFYIRQWISLNGEGPVDVFVMGMTLRWEDAERYAQEIFGSDRRVICIPSYVTDLDLLGVEEHPKVKKGFFRHVWDGVMTLVDRAKTTRNLDLPELWSRLAELGCPVKVSYHESGANHDLLKNVAAIVAALARGVRIPRIVITSGSIGSWALGLLRDAGVVAEEVNDPRDVVPWLETPAQEVIYALLGVDQERLERAPLWVETIATVAASAGGTVLKVILAVPYLVREVFVRQPTAFLSRHSPLPAAWAEAILAWTRKPFLTADDHAGAGAHGKLGSIHDHEHGRSPRSLGLVVRHPPPPRGREPRPPLPRRYRMDEWPPSRLFPPGGPPPVVAPSVGGVGSGPAAAAPDGGGGGGGGTGGPSAAPPDGQGDRRRGGPSAAPPSGGGGGRTSGPLPGGGGLGVATATAATAAAAAHLRAHMSHLRPSPVGGVYLGGAGGCLDGLGQLTGIAVEEKTGNLVLLTDRNGQIDLPPLRLDDLVVIFRSVYLYGEGPSVTINPRPDHPHGPLLDVVHGKATPDTYVGWVLFETDRIMKCYNQGEDNVSRKPTSSAVPGYEEVLDTVYFGGDLADGRQPGGNWERYWIVPAEVTRYRAASGELTLFDVPLKVNTQRMVLRKGKLEDDPNGQSSKGALAFIEWFTRHFEGIAQEQFLQPPPESGFTEPVPIYAELRRIALTTAIAEQLRDQGVPLPFWMRDYPVQRVPVVSTTPSLTVTREKEEGLRTLTAQIYGGVNLSPADSVVRSFASTEDAERLPVAQREIASENLTAASALAPALAAATAARPSLTPFDVTTPEREIAAVSLPGAASTGLAPCRLQEEDLVVTGHGDVRLPLVRHFNSFFQPSGELGMGWSLDLPRLERAIKRTRCADYTKEFVKVPELLTPLNTLHASFSRTGEVPQLGGARLYVPDDPCEILALAVANDPLVPAATDQVIFRDGRSWFFDGDGRFVAQEAKPFTTVYRRDESGGIARISGYRGGRETAAMRLDYDDHGRLRAAAPLDLKQATVPHEKASRRWLFGGLFGGHHKAEPVADPGRVLDDGAAFEYDKNGMLASVVTPDGKVSYTYANGWVTGVARAAKGTDTADAEPEVRKFEYAPNGQLAGELAPDGTRISYDVRPQEGGRQVRISAGDAQVVANYDAADRPLALRHADGTQTTWHYAEDGVVTAGAVLPTGELGRITWSGDGRQRTVRASDGPAVREELDDAGRMVKLAVESTPAAGDDVPATAAVDLPMDEVLTQQWGADGTLRSLDLKTHAILPEYDEHGRVKRVMRVKPTNSGRFTEWQETRFDDLGRVTEVNDNTRGHFALGYDADGNIAGVTTTRLGAEQQEERISYAFTRDALGRITGVTSPGGQETWAYDAAGDPSTVLMKRGQAEARIDFSEGRPKRLSQFDGGRIEFDYQEEGPAKGHLKDVRTPVIDLNYRYDSDGALAEVACGDACRVIYGYDSTGNLASLEYCPAAGS